MANQSIGDRKQLLLTNNPELPLVFQGMEVKEKLSDNDGYKTRHTESHAHQTTRYSIRPYYKPLLVIP